MIFYNQWQITHQLFEYQHHIVKTNYCPQNFYFVDLYVFDNPSNFLMNWTLLT